MQCLKSLFSFEGAKQTSNKRKYAPLAQLVEQLTLNQWVLGSSPRWCTNFPNKFVVEKARWSSGQDGGLSRRKREFDSPTGHQFSLDSQDTIWYTDKAKN